MYWHTSMKKSQKEKLGRIWKFCHKNGCYKNGWTLQPFLKQKDENFKYSVKVNFNLKYDLLR